MSNRNTPTERPNSARCKAPAGLSISRLLVIIFSAGLLIASLVVYSAFVTYRTETVRGMAQSDAKRISHLVFEHLYSVMRKGWTRAEIDDVVHHIQTQLPNYEVTIYRGDPVVRQFGDRPGQAGIRERDPILKEVLQTGTAYFGPSGQNLRYIYPIKTSAECISCHTSAKVGEINGAIGVRVPLSAIETPIVDIALPVMYLTVALVVGLLLATFLIVRSQVSQPIVDLSHHVAELSKAAEYARDLSIGDNWPKEVQSLATNFNDLMDKVRSSHGQLLDASLRDSLTGLFNRRHFDLAIHQAVTDTQAGSLPFAVVYIDLDYFKPVNDCFGHAAGDALLINVAKSITGELRESDLAARIGGDEFAVLALGSTATNASELAERLRHAIQAPQLRFGQETISAACSVGVGCYPGDGQSAEEVLLAADEAMYADKAARKG